jgi:hypothetical protein
MYVAVRGTECAHIHNVNTERGFLKPFVTTTIFSNIWRQSAERAFTTGNCSHLIPGTPVIVQYCLGIEIQTVKMGEEGSIAL